MLSNSRSIKYIRYFKVTNSIFKLSVYVEPVKSQLCLYTVGKVVTLLHGHVIFLKNLILLVLISPSVGRNQYQFIWREANEARLVTKTRWIVEKEVQSGAVGRKRWDMGEMNVRLDCPSQQPEL